MSWPGWLTYSGRLTHINGHPSATGRAQDGKRTLVRDWRSAADNVLCFICVPSLSADLSPCTGCYKLISLTLYGGPAPAVR